MCGDSSSLFSCAKLIDFWEMAFQSLFLNVKVVLWLSFFNG